MVVVPVSYTLAGGIEIETLVAWLQDSTDPVNLTGNEFGQSLYGSQGANSLNGGGGNDYLVGLGGNDFMLGGAGNDNMQGGQGNDIYYVEDASDQIFENAGEGDDLAVCFASFMLGAGQSVETLSANEGSGAINLTGNALAQSLYGNSSANVLTTGGGADYLVGGAGNDIFVISNAPGVAAIADYAAGDVVDVSQYISVANGTNLVAGGYVKVTAAGQLQVDANGGGDGFVTIANVSGSSNVTIRYLAGGSATDLSVPRSASAEVITMTAAVAATGMAAIVPAEAKGDDSDASASTIAAFGNDGIQHHQALAPIVLDDDASIHGGLLAQVAGPHLPVEIQSEHAPAPARATLDHAAYPSALASTADVPAHEAIVSQLAVPAIDHAVLMPAAPMLHVADTTSTQHNQVVAQVLLDVLDGHAGNVESLLAALPGSGAEDANRLASPLADAGGFGGALHFADAPVHAAFDSLQTILAVHVDAAPAA